jgi:hypothetical protein
VLIAVLGCIVCVDRTRKNALVAPVEMKTKSALWVQERIASAQAIAGIRREQSMEVMT